jgi:hypothetical protein
LSISLSLFLSSGFIFYLAMNCFVSQRDGTRSTKLVNIFLCFLFRFCWRDLSLLKRDCSVSVRFWLCTPTC